jgi:glutamate N-acetyltransferase / amino-acid N-acetyltransferase
MFSIQRQKAAGCKFPVGQIARFYSVLSDASIPESKRKYIPTSGTYPKGFLVSGTHVGIKEPDPQHPDLALITSVIPCSAAALFTTNRFQAAPVQVSKGVLEQRRGQGLRSVVINSGCANAVTGKKGLEDAQNMRAKVDEYGGWTEPSTLVMSTGVIGQKYVEILHQ